MSQQLISRYKFFAVDDKAGGPPVIDLDAKAKNVDTYDLLGEDDNEVLDLDDKGEKKGKEDKAEKEEKIEKSSKEDDADSDEDEDEDEDDELEALVEDLEEPDEDKLELVTPVRRRDILAKYPKLFQEFPYLEKAYYREQQFTELYPTIADAKIAHEKSAALDRFDSELMKGQTEGILKAVKGEDENAFHQVVDNYMVALYNVDQTAYYHVLGNINKMTIGQMVQEGKRTNNEQLIAAAAVLQQYVFGTTEWAPPSRLAKQQNKETSTIDTERQQFMQQRYEIARDDLKGRLENVLKATIEQNIDRANVMTGYVKNAATSDALKDLQNQINRDARFQTIQKKLWHAASQANFDKASMDAIKSAFVSKAKTLLPAVLKKARNEALRGLGKRVKDDTSDVNDGTTRSRPNSRNTSSSQSGRTEKDKAKAIPRGMTTLEFLNSD